MTYFWSIFLGAIQGVTEFFPVSSSGHLAVMPYILNFRDPGLAFNIALHAGTLTAILWVFRKDWFEMALGLANKDKKSIKLIAMIALTSVPGAIVGLLFENQAETVFRAPQLVAMNLVIFGILLYFIDKKMSEKSSIDTLTKGQAFLVGVAQAIAIVPGVSRSGATVSAARLLGLKRDEAFRYSFLAAAPIIFGATIYGLRDVPTTDLLSPVWFVGFVAAALASAWAIKFLLSYVKKHDFSLFLWWRLILAAIIAILIITRS